MSKIQNRIDAMDSNELSHHLTDLEGQDKLRIGDGFGDFSEIKDRPYKPKWVVAVSAPFVCLKIENRKLTEILTRSATQSNLQLIIDAFNFLNPSLNYTKKLCRYAVEKTYS